MGYEVKIVADSVGPDKQRITTMQLRYPRFIHAEFMTHRVFSRNASSSRAIPTAKLIEQVRTDPAGPTHWGKNQPGMQANEELTSEALLHVKEMWHAAANRAADNAETLAMLGAHKQIVNRIIEPFLHISVVVTSTQWDNFYALRAHPAAQPEIRRLAEYMREAQHRSIPKKLGFGDWHLPYVGEERGRAYNSVEKAETIRAIKCSVARCARVSYLNHDGSTPSLYSDLALYDRLMASTPKHASPAEHQATPAEMNRDTFGWIDAELQGNFEGWIQYRKMVEENVPV